MDGTDYEHIADSLAKMQQYILEHGWAKGVYVNSAGQVCLVASYNETHRHIDIRYRHQFWSFVETFVRKPIYFNDSPSTTEQDVLNKLHEMELAAKEHAARQ